MMILVVVVICLGDISGHVGRHIDGYDGVHGGSVVVQRNMEGRMLLVFSGERIVCQIHGLRERKMGR